ncbi:MAG TPA: cytochrome c3 family protein [Longimicrobiales bacterium]|nr:cytochrome c3 family protein [Longimicrobiales bacterium]
MGIQGSRALLTLLVFSLVAASGCVDETVVLRDPVLFGALPAEAGGFIGYTDAEAKLTVCGNCHVEKQGDWLATGHAKAWKGLQDSGHASESCESCHATDELGNAATEVAGYSATHDPRYQDVQCEACHGAGLTHVSDPKSTNHPLAPMQVALGSTTGCGECHQGTHTPFVEQWSASRHGYGAHAPQYRTLNGCKQCHGGEAALQAWGIQTEFAEQGTNSLGITCAVCHDPHGGPNEGQLRFPLDALDVDQNLCMKCHQYRAVPDVALPNREPHSPQGPLVLGVDVGWIPPGFPYERGTVVGTHGTAKNVKLCAGCHVNAFEVSDPQTGGHVFTSTGHSFQAIPCVDADGIPTGSDDCAKTASARNFDSCAAGGCHGSPAAAATAMGQAQARIAGLVSELNAVLDKVPAAEFDNLDNRFTSAEGAKFNAALGANPSSAVHNPLLMEALLIASIDEVKARYGVSAASAIALTPTFSPPTR